MTLKGLIGIEVVSLSVVALCIIFFARRAWRKNHPEKIPKRVSNALKRKEDFEIRHDEYLKNNGITVSNTYRYTNPIYDRDIDSDLMRIVYFQIDQTNKKVVIFDMKGLNAVITFSDIIGCEIVVDSQVVGGVGRAMVGGILAGGAGAVVGAVTAKKHIMSYKIVIYTKNFDQPKIDLNLIDRKTDLDSLPYKQVDEFAQNINAVIKSIINQ